MVEFIEFIWKLSPLVLILIVFGLYGRNKNYEKYIKELRDELNEIKHNVYGADKDPEMEKVHEENRRNSPYVPKPGTSYDRSKSVLSDNKSIRSENPKNINDKVQSYNYGVEYEYRPSVRAGKTFEPGHILFALGVVLVFVAGFIFATSMWAIMPSAVKVATLVLASLFFIIVAWLLENKLKLREASVAMFISGSIFMSLAVIAIGYFAWFGSAFSLGSSSQYLVISISCWVMSIALILGYLLYKYNGFRVIAYISSCMAITLFVRHICGKGDITLLCSGLYILLTYIGFVGFRENYLKRLVSVCSFIYVAFTFVMYLSFGKNALMSFVFFVDIVLLFLVAYFESMDRIYLVIPFVSAVFVCSLAETFRVVIPHGDCVIALIIGELIFLVFRKLKIKGKEKLYNLPLEILSLVPVIYTLYNAGRISRKAHNGIGDIPEIVYIMVSALIIIVVFSREYYLESRTYKNGNCPYIKKIHMSVLGISSFFLMYCPSMLIRYFDIPYNNYMSSLISLSIMTLVMSLVIILYQYRLSVNSLTSRIIFTERLGAVLLNFAILYAFAGFTGISHNNYWINTPIIISIIIYQVHLRLKHSNIEGLLSAAILPFVLSAGIDEMLYSLFKNKESIVANTSFEIRMLLFLAFLIVGQFVYKSIISVNKEKKRILMDLNALMAFIMLLMVMFMKNTWKLEHVRFRLIIGAAVLCLYISGRLADNYKKIMLAVMAGLICLAYSIQDFVFWPVDFSREFPALGLLIFAVVLYFVIFKKNTDKIGYICFSLVSVFLCIQWLSIEKVVSEPKGDIINLKLWIFLLSTAAGCIYSVVKNNLRCDIFASLLIGTLTVSCLSNWSVPPLILVSVEIILFVIYLYRRGEQRISFVMLGLLLKIINDVLTPHIYDMITSDRFVNSRGILVKAAEDYTIICVIWIIIFGIMLALGRFLHKKIIEDNKFVDYFTILSFIPMIMVFSYGNPKMVWAVWFMFALYLFGYYKRIGEIFDKPLLSGIVICIAGAWWTEPLFVIDDLFVTEWRIAGFLFLSYGISGLIYKRELEGRLDIMYWASVASVIWQSLSALKDSRLFDVILLASILVLVLVISFEKKSKRWFLLSTISLFCIFIYMSRNFWLKIVWPVYVFAIGIFLIFLAARNEYRKKLDITKENKRKFFEEWNK
ncbi:MAG: hypothetical protein K6E98_00505 [Lachnospiraceae bacterium]|nr:hypothetical protein [Lachnospiraceae bacterium]